MATRPTMTGSIQPLPQDVVAQLKSSTAIVSLSGVVLGLIENALDAGATRVEGLVDFARGGCSIEDDGKGIAPYEFREDGALGKLYYTSKYFSNDACLGRHGTFLASLAAVSLLTITSHHHEHRSHNSITLHHSNVVERHLPAPTRHELNYIEHGTRATVRNLFGNLPVRVKQRAIVAEQKTEHDRLWEYLKREVAGLLLSWKRPVSVKLRDAEYKPVVNFTTRNSASTATVQNTSGSRPEHLQHLLNILSQAGWISIFTWPSWVPASASTPNISIKGAISLEPAPTKRVQFISLGILPLSADAGHNVLYDEVNRLFGLSSFGTEMEDGDIDDREKVRRANDKRFKKDGYTHQQLRGRKGVDRYPMFHLRICLKNETHQTRDRARFLDSGANIQTVIDVLQAMITQWLSVHHLRPREVRLRRSRPDSASALMSERDSDSEIKSPLSCGSKTDVTSRPRSANDFERKRKASGAELASLNAKRKEQSSLRDWSRIKSGKSAFYDSIWASEKLEGQPKSLTALDGPIMSTSPPSHSPFNMPIIPAGSLSVNKTVVIEQLPANKEVSSTCEEEMPDDRIAWRDPTSKHIYFLNARTGCVVPDASSRPHSDSAAALPRKYWRDVGKTLRLQRRTETADGAKNLWLNGLLRTWENPVFRPAEQSIPQVALDGHDAGIDYRKLSSHFHCSRIDIDTAFSGTVLSSENKLSKAGLQDAQIIAQLDRKFILVKMFRLQEPSHKNEEEAILVLVDQHAADERIRVESLLAELCTPVPDTDCQYRSNLGLRSKVGFSVLEKPLKFAVSTQEGQLFRTQAAAFAAWGILFDIVRPNGMAEKVLTPEGDVTTISVTTLPPSISERCKADPKLLISFLRSTLWKYAEAPLRTRSSKDEALPSTRETAGTPPLWLRQLASCPQGLVDMINSRACRSAIMFNDELTIEQCEELLTKLSRCVFPFMCAHGRPSMVPLVTLGDKAFIHDNTTPGLESRIVDDFGSSEGFVHAWKRWKQR